MKKAAILILFIFLFIQCQESGEESFPIDLSAEPDVEAQATIFSLTSLGDDRYEVNDQSVGTANFAQREDVVTIEINLTGMTPNSSKAVHIHNGSVNEPGRHWNRQSFYAFCNKRSLGELWAKPFAGDVGNVQINEDGNGSLTLHTDLWALNSGDIDDILDKVIIVHDDPEDFVLECDPNHPHDHVHTNLKIGGGTITLTTDMVQRVQSAMTSYPDFTVCK